MKRSLLLVILFLILPFADTMSQSPELKETFLEAESYFLFEEYNEALPLYLKIHRVAPENNNINYKIGICFLNDPYQKEKSISYLQKATQEVNPKYKENNFKEKTAPMEAFFYLGKAYLVNNELDSALANFKYFRSILDEKIYDVELVEEQISICEAARDLNSRPVDYDFENLTEVINSRFADINPIVSGDGKRLVFVSKRQFYDATFFAEKVNGVWQPPRNIIPELGVDGDVYPTSLSWNGTKMIIYRNDDFIGNLYMSEYVNGQWTAMKKLGDNINTKYWESHGSFSKNGKTLYFTSNRKEGYGGLDIYKSELQTDGTWGVPKNLGNKINTRYNEDTPFITENGKSLYFSSYGHYNMGGYDVFYSNADSKGEWGTPINLGYPINTTDDDLFYFPVNNGNNAYFSIYLEDGFGRHDIYYLTIYSDNNPRMYLISGKLASDKGKIVEKDSLQLYLVDPENGDTLQISKPNLTTQSFELKAPKGQYDLILHSVTFNDLITRININERTEKSGITIADKIALETKPYEPLLLTGADSRIEVEDSIIVAEPGKLQKIRLNLVPGSTLIANHFVDSILVSSDTFQIEKKRFVYEYFPEAGLNTVDFTSVEKNGDTSKNSIIINVANKKINKTILSSPDTTAVSPSPGSETMLNDAGSIKIIKQEIKDLSDYASGDLKNILDNINVTSSDITSIDDLYNYIENQGVSEAKLNDLRAISKVENDASELLQRLIQNSNGDLHKYLRSLDLEALGIDTAEELMDYLRKEAEKNEMNETEFNKLVSDIIASPSELDKTLKALKSLSEGELYEYLKDINLDEMGIFSSAELLSHLTEHFGNSYKPELLIPVLTDVISEKSLENFKEYLISNGPPNLAEFLKSIHFEKENIHNNEDLVAFLHNNAEKIGLSKAELDILIINLMADFKISPILDSDTVIHKNGMSTEMAVTGGLLLLGVLIFIIFFLRKKKKKDAEV